MKSLTTSVALLNSMTKVPAVDTTNTTLLKQLWNDSVRTVCSIRSGKWWFLQTTTNIATVASQQGYYVPAGVRKIIDLYTTVGSQVYTPIPIYSSEAWNAILASNLGESDIPMFYYIQGNRVLIAPTPSSTAGTITIRGRKNIPDLTVDDDTVTVSAIANGATAVTISSGGLVSMAGKYIRISAIATGAANAGDGQWYEIASSASGTLITLVTPYQGVTITGGSATATVSQMTPIPEAYDMAPIYRTMALFSQINDPLHPNVSNAYWRLYDGGQEAGLNSEVGGLIGQMMENEGESTEGAYISPLSRSLDGAYGPPYYLPRQDASGF
jgi:hypothetical protein